MKTFIGGGGHVNNEKSHKCGFHRGFYVCWVVVIIVFCGVIQDERDNELLNTMDAEDAATKAMDDLANAEEEIRALEELLRAHERELGVSVTS